MSDQDRQFAELLQSPLEEEPQRGLVRVPGWAVAALLVLTVVVLTVVLVTRDGGEVASPTTVAGGTAATNAEGAVVTTVGGASGSPTTAGAEAVAEDPGTVVFQDMVATDDGTIVMFGGLTRLSEFDTAPSPDTWLLDSTTGEWDRVHLDDAPSPRAGHSMVFHPPSGKVVLFGGGTTEFGACRLVRRCPGPQDAQLWVFDPVERTWEDLTREVPDDEEGTWPEFRYGAAMAVDGASGEIVLYGGVGVFGGRNPLFYDDTWVLDLDEVSWRRLEIEEPPPGRTFHAMTQLGDTFYMFGGDAPAGSDDPRLWAFRLEDETWTEVAGEGPTSRWMSMMVVDPVGERLVLVGGEGNIFNQIAESVSIREVDAMDEVWTWSEAEGWLARNPLPEALIWAVGVADPATESVLLHDGADVLRYDRGLDLWGPLTS